MCSSDLVYLCVSLCVCVCLCVCHCVCVCVCVRPLLVLQESLMLARWPAAGPVDELLLLSSQYLTETAHDLRLRLKAYLMPPKSKVLPGQAPRA